MTKADSETGSGPRVFNQGRCGQNTTVARAVYENDLLGPGVKPDFVFIYLGMNDVINDRFFTPLDECLSHLRWMINLARNAGIRPVICSIHHVIEEVLYKHHAREHFGNETVNGKMDRYNAAIRRMAIAEQVGLADFGAVTAQFHPSQFLSRDGVHLSASGNQLLAKTFYHVVENALRPDTIIVCVGDSLTYGYENQGAGTAEGETYPAYLLKMMSLQVIGW